ncbi:MAG: ribbon-helix-helix domain-containing protein [Coriobacteriia bacterium]
MARMIRKQIVIDPEQERALAARAEVLGVSQSELIRQAIDTLLKETEAAARKEAAWQELMRGIEQAHRDGVGSRGNKWTREELHDRSDRSD